MLGKLGNLMFDRVDLLLHFINLLLGYGKSKRTFGFCRRDPDAARHEMLNLQWLDQRNNISLLIFRELRWDWGIVRHRCETYDPSTLNKNVVEG
jgi:hypothetical protein